MPTASVPSAEAPADLKAKAAALNAVPWAELSKMEVGDEAVFLIQGTKGGAAVYGSGPYTIDSHPPAAAVHAGVLKDGEWGLVRVVVVKHDGNHVGTERNGVKTRDWGSLDRSYTITRVKP